MSDSAADTTGAMSRSALTVLRCADCGGELAGDQERVCCRSCGAAWPVRHGIPFFDDGTPYWGEIPQENMRDIVALARERDWRGVEAYLDEKFPKRKTFVYGDMRADWRFLLPVQPGWRVLEMGCGWGTHTMALARNGAEVFSQDATAERVEFLKHWSARQDCSGVHPVVCRAPRLPYADESFDLVVMNGFLEWVACAYPEDVNPRAAQLAFLKTAHRLLKPGGYIYVGIENRLANQYFRGSLDHSGLKYTSLMPRFLADAVCRRRKGQGYREYTYTRRGYERLVRSAGFLDPRFFVPIPSYNMPETIVPFEDMPAYMSYARRTQGGAQSGVKRLLSKLIAVPGFTRIYRMFVFSYLFTARKNG